MYTAVLYSQKKGNKSTTSFPRVVTLVVMCGRGSWRISVSEHQLSKAAVISVSHAKENQHSLVVPALSLTHTAQTHAA